MIVALKHWGRCLSACSTRLNMGETILGKVISTSFAGVGNIDFPNNYHICVYQWCVELGADSASLVPDVPAMLCRNWTCGVRYVWGGIRRIWGYIRIRVHSLRGKCGYREEGSKSCTPKTFGSPGRFSGQHRRWNFVKSVIWMSILYPIGEACNPGPSNGQANNWEFGIFNPSGLSNKTNLVANMDGEIWGCSETHLTKHGVSQLKTGLKALKSPYKFVLAGHPAETKTTADVGTYTGVLLLSKHPARALMHDVPKDLYDTGRLQFSGVYVQGLWVQIGTVYGFPIGSNHAHHRYQTDLLLEAAIDRIGLQTTGPRIICGDLNHHPQDLSQVNKLRSLGFAEAQELALFRWGQVEQATGKGTLKLDQIWLSIELQQILTRVSVDHQTWADHATVRCHFNNCEGMLVRDEWHMPAQFPWPTQWQCEVAFDGTSPLTVAYAKMWNTIERQAATIHAHQGRVIEEKFFGRGRTLRPHSKTTNGAPCKVGREGEDHPSFFGRSTKHLRWFKQLRRFQALARLPNTPNSMTCVHKAEIWRAIRHATGFEGGFSKWWVTNFPEGAFEGGLPIIVPEQSQVVDMYQAFRCKVRDFERSLKQVRISEAKQRRLDDVSLIFKDCPKEQPTQVDTLIDARVETITEVNQDDSSIVLAGPIKLIPDTPVIARGKSLDIIFHDHDQLWLADVEELECGDQIRQEKITASDRDILQEFQRVWEGRWVKPAHLLSSQWEQVVGFLSQAVRPITWSFADWSGEGLRKIVKAKKKRSATGPDGVSRHDLVNLPDTGVSAIVEMFKCIEAAGQWPKQLQVGIVKSLDKNKGANGVDGFRPITIYPLLYRAWSSFRAKQALKVLATVVPNSVRGGLPSRQSKTIWYEVSQLLESAHHSGTALAGVVLDIRRAFNALPRIPLWEMLQLLDFPPNVLKTWGCLCVRAGTKVSSQTEHRGRNSKLCRPPRRLRHVSIWHGSR